MARATIRDVAAHAKLSVSTVNRAIHEPGKVRGETLQMILQAAEAVGFYGIASIKQSLAIARPRLRIGVLLLQRNRVLYRDLNIALEAAAKAVRDHDVMIRIEHLEDLSPQNVADGLFRLAETSDCLCVVSTEHPIVSSAIEALAARQIKTFALISPLNARCNVGYLGIDNWKSGRTAGWAIHNICKRDGKVGILVGNHRYRCQEDAESGFRSYLREHPNNFEVLEAQSTFETESIAREVTESLLEKHRDLVGLYVAGGGISGACAALRDSKRGNDIVMVGHDFTEVTRGALLDGTVNLIISHPLLHMAQETIAAMIRSFDGGADFPPQSISLPFDLYTPENI